MVRKIHAGEVLGRRTLVTINAELVQIPDNARLVHLQFRRFAGCPVCNLHLRSVEERHGEILAAGVREVVVFHSAADALRSKQRNLPFAVIADPERRLYSEFGVMSSLRAFADPRAWLPALRGAFRAKVPVFPSFGETPFGLPADFLIGPDGRVIACKYGVHAHDQWSVDELLGYARRHKIASTSLRERWPMGVLDLRVERTAVAQRQRMRNRPH